MRHRLLTFMLGLLMANLAMANSLQLPEKHPDLNTTESKRLGTLDEGIGIPVGTMVSNFSIKDHKGTMVEFEQLKTQGPLMVVFYRGGWCPYCNRQIRQLTEAWPEFKKRNVLPVLISADKPDGAALAAATYEIPFPVLSDPELVAHKVFNVTMKLDDKLIPMYKQYGIDLEEWSGKDHHQFAVSSVFIVNSQGKVLWAHSAKDYKTRPSTSQLLNVIDYTF